MKPEITILGGGFSGLTTAYYLVKAGHPVRVYEPNQLGGLIQTQVSPQMQVESAANAFLLTEELQNLCQDIGCSLLPVQQEGQAKFIWRQGLRRWPLGLRSTLFLLCFALPRWVLFRSTMMPRSRESIKEWCLRVLNSEIFQFLVEPALQGIYAGDGSQLSASLILKKRGARGRGSRAPQGGMAEFISKLEAYLKSQGVKFLSEAVESCDHIKGPKVLAVPLLALFKLQPHLQTHRLTRLNLARITVGFTSNTCRKIPGFGVLIPRGQGFQTLGVIANSQIFPHRGQLYNESWILGGAFDSEVLEKSDQSLMQVVLNERKKILKAEDSVQQYSVVRCPQAYVHYDIKLESWIEQHAKEFVQDQKQIWITGNYLGSIGLSQILRQNYILAQHITGVLWKK